MGPVVAQTPFRRYRGDCYAAWSDLRSRGTLESDEREGIAQASVSAGSALDDVVCSF